MYHAHVVSIWIGLLTALIRSDDSDQIREQLQQQLADFLTKKGSFTGDRSKQLTLLVNIMTHTTFTQSKLSVSSEVVNLFQHT